MTAALPHAVKPLLNGVRVTAAVAAPALAAGPSPGKGSWVNTVADLLRRTPRISTMKPI